MASSTIPSVTAAGTSPVGLIASDIVEQLFPELPLAERAALGDILESQRRTCDDKSHDA
jgi:hypothetical protein